MRVRRLVAAGRGCLGTGRQDLTEQARELLPLGVPPATAQAASDFLHVTQGADLSLQLGDRPGRRRLVEDLIGCLLLLVRRQILQVLQIVSIQRDP